MPGATHRPGHGEAIVGSACFGVASCTPAATGANKYSQTPSHSITVHSSIPNCAFLSSERGSAAHLSFMTADNYHHVGCLGSILAVLLLFCAGLPLAPRASPCSAFAYVAVRSQDLSARRATSLLVRQRDHLLPGAARPPPQTAPHRHANGSTLLPPWASPLVAPPRDWGPTVSQSWQRPVRAAPLR